MVGTPQWKQNISIHALREEGDVLDFSVLHKISISIHALREEGDAQMELVTQPIKISIHALREEGDSDTTLDNLGRILFLSTPSARRATALALDGREILHISIHALREEGDSKNRDKISIFKQIIQHSARI